MALPYEPVNVKLAPDDVRSVEILNDLYRAHDDAVELLETEHFVSGANRGKHNTIVVPTAVARVEFVGIDAKMTRDPVASDMRVVWSAGFARGPELLAGEHPLFAGEEQARGVYVTWEIADRRARDVDIWSLQLCTSTPMWDGSGCGFLPMFRCRRAEGALRIADIFRGEDDGPTPDPVQLVPLKGLMLAVYLALPP